jgi:hypothetical protein
MKAAHLFHQYVGPPWRGFSGLANGGPRSVGSVRPGLLPITIRHAESEEQ